MESDNDNANDSETALAMEWPEDECRQRAVSLPAACRVTAKVYGGLYAFRHTPETFYWGHTSVIHGGRCWILLQKFILIPRLETLYLDEMLVL